MSLLSSIRYYFHVTNWHKHPWVSPLLCRLGRHDYELERGVLTCFYCRHKKSPGSGCLYMVYNEHEVGDIFDDQRLVSGGLYELPAYAETSSWLISCSDKPTMIQILYVGDEQTARAIYEDRRDKPR
jgi:hypothetical protein